MKNAHTCAPVRQSNFDLPPQSLKLACQAECMTALKSVVQNGADEVRIVHAWRGQALGSLLGDDRNFLEKGIRYAHDHACLATLDLVATAEPSDWSRMCRTIDLVAALGVDAIVLSDPALLLYAKTRHPHLALRFALPHHMLHPAAVRQLQRYAGIDRIVLPKVVSLDQIRQIASCTKTAMELSAAAHLHVSLESNHAGKSARQDRPCAVLNYGTEEQCDGIKDSLVGPCGDGEIAPNDLCYSTNAPRGTTILRALPELSMLRVQTILISDADLPANGLPQITRIWREAVDACREKHGRFTLKPSWVRDLNKARGGLRSS